MTEYKVVPVELTENMLRSAMQFDKIQEPADDPDMAESLQTDWSLMLAASPDTGMVAVPRELLERLLANDGGDGRYSLTDWNAARNEIRAILEASQ